MDTDDLLGQDFVIEPTGQVRELRPHEAPFRAVWCAVAPLALRLAQDYEVPVGFLGTGGAAAFTLTGFSTTPAPAFAIYDRYRPGKQSALILANVHRRSSSLAADRRLIGHHIDFARDSGLRWFVLEHADPITLDLVRDLAFRRGREFGEEPVDGAITMPYACDLDSWYLDLRAGPGIRDCAGPHLVGGRVH